MKKLKILLSMLFLFLVAPYFVQAATTERTNSLDLSILDLAINQGNTDEGWSWDASSKTLTLTDIDFNITDEYGIKLPNDLDIKINLVGENEIIAKKPIYRFSAINDETITITGTGKLNIVSKDELAALDLVNLTIESGDISATGTVNVLKKLKITGGTLDVNTSNVSDTGSKDGIVADGSIEISDGKVNINAKEYGMVVKGINEVNPTLGVNITGGEISINASLAAIYAGNSSVTPAVKKDVVIDGAKLDFKDSPIGILSSEGNITIKSSYIEYLDTTEVYKFDSLNSINVATIGPADYSELEDLLSNITTNLSIYLPETVENLNNVINSIVYEKNTIEQKIVNEYVSNLTNALNNLVLKRADYSEIDELINSVDLSRYTNETVNRFNEFVNSIDRNINILNQAVVDEYIDELNNIINCLITKPIENVDGIIDDSGSNITVPSYNNNYNTGNNNYNESSNNTTDNKIENSNTGSDDIDEEDKSEVKDDDKDKSESKEDKKQDTEQKTNKKSNKILLIILWIILGLIGLLILVFIILLIIKKVYAAKRRKEATMRRNNTLNKKTVVTKNVVKKELPHNNTKSTTNNSSTKKKSNNTTKKKTTSNKTITKKK